MGNKEFEDLGDKIQDIIEKAVDSKNYQKLNQSINQAVNKAIDSGSEALKGAFNSSFNPEHNARAYETRKNHGYQQPPFGKQQRVEQAAETKPSVYGKTTGENLKGMMLAITGGILSSGMGLGLLVAILARTFGFVSSSWLGITILMASGAVVGTGLLIKGCKNLGRLGRFRRYIQALGQHTYCNFEQLSRVVGKPVKFVKKDIKAMIHRGWFLEGHVDQQETCLITSNETYRQYVETQKQLEMKKRADEPKVETDTNTDPQVQEVLDKGNDYLTKIHKCNDAIPGVEISAKISRIEMLVQRIFQRAKEHPEIIPDLKRMMDYYLPMTVKLLDAYADMDSQPIQGENIKASKSEIEATLDTLNKAFEKLLDSIFKDTAWDVSSDISVLHTILAQEGLTEDDFTKMKQES
ncbi:MAG: 5-bromo-4-chloroindolyl phosphate hydrolysis family protein [Eubacteriales bacterium]|nr:5-bromo-4-chloroindolyl phosphate hydrolysis family protein [Eubacteriales bacterium]